ncbi:UNVERIFIED_CONTAM: hypothetical protein Sradi_5244700 [Sesamum radiatum]|uniref:Uncharacterized protein n=1 Tax=Sesamum radiatum TaxID=300843 RepID=A0AAW2LKP7_SESRA
MTYPSGYLLMKLANSPSRQVSCYKGFLLTAKGKDDSVEPSVENTFQEGEASNPQPISVANDLDEINVILDEEAEEVDSIEFEALRHTMDFFPARIGDEEHDEEEEFEEIESEEDSLDDKDHNSSDSDSDKDDDMGIDN